MHLPEEMIFDVNLDGQHVVLRRSAQLHFLHRSNAVVHQVSQLVDLKSITTALILLWY